MGRTLNLTMGQFLKHAELIGKQSDIDYISITNKRPERAPNTLYRWQMAMPVVVVQSLEYCKLPPMVYKLLKFAQYPTLLSAMNDLSQACLSLAKTLVCPSATVEVDLRPSVGMDFDIHKMPISVGMDFGPLAIALEDLEIKGAKAKDATIRILNQIPRNSDSQKETSGVEDSKHLRGQDGVLPKPVESD